MRMVFTTKTFHHRHNTMFTTVTNMLYQLFAGEKTFKYFAVLNFIGL